MVLRSCGKTLENNIFESDSVKSAIWWELTDVILIFDTKMLVLFETAAGYAVFKLLNEKKLQETENLYLDFQTPEKANKLWV